MFFLSILERKMWIPNAIFFRRFAQIGKLFLHLPVAKCSWGMLQLRSPLGWLTVAVLLPNFVQGGSRCQVARDPFGFHFLAIQAWDNIHSQPVEVSPEVIGHSFASWKSFPDWYFTLIIFSFDSSSICGNVSNKKNLELREAKIIPFLFSIETIM